MLIHIGFDKFVEKENVLGIFNPKELIQAETTPEFKKFINIKPDKPTRSLIYCKGEYMIASPIDANTIKKRYENYQDMINGLFADESIYLKISE